MKRNEMVKRKTYNIRECCTSHAPLVLLLVVVIEVDIKYVFSLQTRACTVTIRRGGIPNARHTTRCPTHTQRRIEEQKITQT